MRWPIPAGAGVLACACLCAAPAPARADDPLYTCAKAPADAKLTIQFTPDLTLRDLGAWLTGFTCKSVIYDGEAVARAPKLMLIAPTAVTPRQAVQLFIDTVKKAGLAVAEKPDTFIVSLDPAAQRRCLAPPAAPRAGAGAGACAKAAADAKLALSFKPDTTLEDLALWITGFSCKQVSFDPSIATQATQVSLIVSAKVTPRQASRLFVDAIEATGLTVTETAAGFDVKPGPRWAHCKAAARPPALAPGPAPVVPVVPAPTPTPVPPAPDPAIDVAAVLDAGIRKIDATHYEVTRAARDQILDNPMAFAKGARIVPAMKNGQLDGFKVYALRAGSLLERIGVRNGDTLQTLGGHSLSEPDKALEAYSALRTATQIELGLVRSGAAMTIAIAFVK
ncbi:MAG TPA: type II secretion system protein GspC [Kofleriaceae bacterium]|nr:type II secretion system protein GspC [Kofleriaceae bacterium]